MHKILTARYCVKETSTGVPPCVPPYALQLDGLETGWGDLVCDCESEECPLAYARRYYWPVLAQFGPFVGHYWLSIN